MVFPRLYHLTSQPNGTIAEVWSPSTDAWDLNPRWKLNELEIIEWTTLSHLLSSICLGNYMTTDLGLLILPRP